MQANGPCENALSGWGLKARISTLHVEFLAQYPEETLGEEKAWLLIVEATLVFAHFMALSMTMRRAVASGVNRTATNKAFYKALRGYRTAFPEEVAVPGIRQAIETAARRCAEALSLDMDDTRRSGESRSTPGTSFPHPRSTLLKESGATE